jgi:hypothetical protein
MTSFADARKQAEAEGLLGGAADYLKLKEGGNRMRLYSMCLPHPGTYKGQKTFKWLCYVIDRTDGKFKLFFMPNTIYKQIEALQENPDYEFSDVPMPYDITVHAKGAGSKDVEYSLLPAKKETLITAAEREAYTQQTPLAEVQGKLREKEAKDAPQAGAAPINADDIPF